MTDRDNIIDVLVRYAAGIDSRDWALFRKCFTDDAHFDYGGIGTWDSADALMEFMRRTHSGPSLHRLTNFVIDIDADRATARTYIDAEVMGPRGFGVVNTFGWYDDQLRRTADGWRITFRRTTCTVSACPVCCGCSPHARKPLGGARRPLVDVTTARREAADVNGPRCCQTAVAAASCSPRVAS